MDFRKQMVLGYEKLDYSRARFGLVKIVADESWKLLLLHLASWGIESIVYPLRLFSSIILTRAHRVLHLASRKLIMVLYSRMLYVKLLIYHHF
jgi:hypothetical protein